MVLYRKYRPQKFNDLVGQEHIKKILMNALTNNRVSHAYIFSGPRGVGKTTVARILAKSLNCLKRAKKDAEPCDVCLSCKEIIQDSSLDVIEIDAASNRGIDEIRELREKIRFSPSGKGFKVYIIDEVHMLTREAFNALLKTLEEPPKHAIFIMATTELYRVPDTIISRSQQIDFRKASIREITKNLEKIAKEEKIILDSKATETIARYASGSFRDALSLLDQLISTGNPKIDLKIVQEILGIPSEELILNFVEAIRGRSTKKAINIIDDIRLSGYDPAQFLDMVIEKMRTEMLSTYDYSLFDDIKLLLKAKEEIKYSSLPLLPLELAVVKISEEIPANFNLKKDKQKESKIEKIVETKTIFEKPHNDPVENVEKEVIAKENILADKTVSGVSSEKLKKNWKKVIELLKEKNHSLTIILSDSLPLGIDNGIMQIAVSNKFYGEKLKEAKKYQILCEVLESVFGKKIGFMCKVMSEADMKKISQEESKKIANTAREIFDLEE